MVSRYVAQSSLGGDTHRVCDSWSEGPGFESCVGWLLWCGHIPVVPNWFNKGLVVCITVYGCVHLKDPLESIEKSRGLSPGSGFLSVADMSITVTKGDVKLQQTNKQGMWLRSREAYLSLKRYIGLTLPSESILRHHKQILSQDGGLQEGQLK